MGRFNLGKYGWFQGLALLIWQCFLGVVHLFLKGTYWSWGSPFLALGGGVNPFFWGKYLEKGSRLGIRPWGVVQSVSWGNMGLAVLGDPQKQENQWVFQENRHEVSYAKKRKSSEGMLQCRRVIQSQAQ